MTDVVEAMARAYYRESTGSHVGTSYEITWDDLDDLGKAGALTKANVLRKMRAAIRACHDAGGLVVGKMPASVEGVGEFLIADNDRMRHAMIAARASGHNAALAAVRAAAVEVV